MNADLETQRREAEALRVERLDFRAKRDRFAEHAPDPLPIRSRHKTHPSPKGEELDSAARPGKSA